MLTEKGGHVPPFFGAKIFKETIMKRQQILFAVGMTLASLFAAHATTAEAQQQSAQMTEEQLLLQRVYNLRMRIDQDKARRDNEARANVRLVTQSPNPTVDSPTVSAYRAQTNVQLSRFEQMFRCLDVDLEGTTGNTVVICGDNAGDINGSNVSAQRDIVTVQGGQQ